MSAIVNVDTRNLEYQSHRRYPENWMGDGWIAVPPELEARARASCPYCVLEIENGALVNITPLERPAPDLDTIRAAKLAELSDACNAAIVAGCDVTLTDGTVEHFALEETDQINLNAAYTACQQGATEYPYHADGQLCRLYSAADIIAIGDAATAHKLYHTTYCNHLLTWSRRAEAADELAAITYGAELPEDLAANMTRVLGGAT